MAILTPRQKQILSFLKESIAENGYAPSLTEIGRHFNLHSISTVQRHLVHLEEKGLIRRHWNRSRAIEVVGDDRRPEARDVPLEGLIAAGAPIEAVRGNELVAVPADMIGRREVFVLKVHGESMVDEQVRDGDYVIVEKRTDPRNGEMVVALVNGDSATLKKFYREKDQIRLQPAHPTMKPMFIREEDVAIQGVVVGLLRKY
ncbi:MAG TPA: transcriptional repressor LexA [Vicinamibacteria bacterium]|nr:transcriptional repressor LexA [Vicinamibacteria bacterium]